MMHYVSMPLKVHDSPVQLMLCSMEIVKSILLKLFHFVLDCIIVVGESSDFVC
jgi:hypothetical protein